MLVYFKNVRFYNLTIDNLTCKDGGSVAQCTGDVDLAVHCGSPQGVCSLFPGLDTLVWPVERCSLFTQSARYS